MPDWKTIETLAEIPRFHARWTPKRTALAFADRRTTFAALEKHCAEAAAALSAEGVRPGDRVAWLDLNSDRTYEMLFACARSGAVFCPINWRLSVDEIREVLEDAKAEILFVGKRFFDIADQLELPGLRKIVAIDGEREGWEFYCDWRVRHGVATTASAGAPGDPAIQIYTSGTTGRPKGVVLSNSALLSTGKESDGEMAWNDWGPDDVGLLTMPSFHIAGLRWGVMGLAPGAMTAIMPEFSPEGVVDMIAAHHVTRLFLAPTAIRLVLRAAEDRKADFSSLKLIWYGASPISPGLLKEAMRAFGCQFIQTYGMTETGAQATFLPPADHDPRSGERMRSAGKALPGVQIRIVDENGAALPAGAVGEICIKSPSNMLGYWRREDETRALLRDGWMHSGDAGYLDTDGYVYIHDRIKDMIVTGGENVYSTEVENVLAAHPAVAEAAVIGVPDEKWGEAVKAIIVLKSGVEASAEEIVTYVRSRIASYKAPKSVDFVDALPKNPTGKIQKNKLREKYWAGRRRMVS